MTSHRLTRSFLFLQAVGGEVRETLNFEKKKVSRSPFATGDFLL
jgi:hypothetical protein